MVEAWYIIPLFVTALFIGLRRRAIVKKKPRLPLIGYKLIYSDQKTKDRDKAVIYSKLLSSEKYGLSGKPDFIYKRNRRYLPVELKSGSIGDAKKPRDGDLMQLAAYFLIIEDLYGTKPRTGRLIYKDYMFNIRNTWALRRELTSVVVQMRGILETGKGFDDSAENAGFSKCRNCICRETVCDKL